MHHACLAYRHRTAHHPPRHLTPKAPALWQRQLQITSKSRGILSSNVDGASGAVYPACKGVIFGQSDPNSTPLPLVKAWGVGAILDGAWCLYYVNVERPASPPSFVLLLHAPFAATNRRLAQHDGDRRRGNAPSYGCRGHRKSGFDDRQ